MFDSDALERRREIDQGYGMGGWSEHYSDNPIINRFIQVKFHDNGFWLANNLKSHDVMELRYSPSAKMWAILPAPVLKLLGVTVNKSSILAFSVGDLMFIRGTGILFGGLRTGSLLAHGVTVAGWMFLGYMFFLALAVFTMSDALTAPTSWSQAELRGVAPRAGPAMIFSVAGLINIYLLTLMFNAESFVDIVQWIIRGFLQLIVLYLVLFHGTRVLFGGRLRG